MDVRESVEQIFELDEKINALKLAFEQSDPTERASVLFELFNDATGELGDDDPVSLKLIRIVELLSTLEGDKPAQILSSGFDHENEEIRELCAEALAHLAIDGVDQILPAVEEALDTGGNRAEEILGILAEIEDPETLSIIERFLELDDADLVALAIETLAEVGDSGSLSALKRLVEDERTVTLDDTDSTTTEDECTVGQLAQDAIDLITKEDK